MHTTHHAPMRTRRLPQQRANGEQTGEQPAGIPAQRPGRANDRRRAIAEQLELLAG